MDITVGMKGEAEVTVTQDKTAKAMCSGGLDVFATPWLVAMMEYAACNAIHPHLDEGLTSVGTGLEVKHTAATPVGMKVRACAEVTAVDRRSVTFKVTAFDEKGEIGSGIHSRFIVDSEKFMSKTYSKLD
ncbi:MAG: thioesterase family protein [Oscillospiraceae bacterium]